jgi:hypothetical protein
MVSRMLGVAPTIADAIVDQLSRPSDKAVAAGEAVQSGRCTAVLQWCSTQLRFKWTQYLQTAGIVLFLAMLQCCSGSDCGCVYGHCVRLGGELTPAVSIVAFCLLQGRPTSS